MNNEKWVDSIIEAMQIWGGEAKYENLYPLIRDIRYQKGLTIPDKFEETVRRCVQDHSSDSKGFRGKDIFIRLGKGHWGLRENYRYALTFMDEPIEKQAAKDVVHATPIELSSVEDDIAMAEDGKQLSNMEEVKIKKLHYLYEGRLKQGDIKRIKVERGYVCEACGISLAKLYPGLGNNFIECHHTVPYSEMKEGAVRTLNVTDFMVLCPNCHRMIHRLDNPADLEGLKQVLAKGQS